MNADVTVIVPAFNEESNIQRCIDSLLVQTIVPQIIVVNDGSYDSTIQKLEKYKNIDNFLLINQSNRGVSVARNRGIESASTKFITFVDADDYVEKSFIETLLNSYYRDYEIDLSICNYSMKRLNDNVTFYGNFTTSVIGQSEYFNSVIDEMGVNGFVYNKMFKKSLIDKYNIKFDPDISIGEDFFFCFQYGKACKKISLNDSVQIHYLPTASGVSDTMQINGRFSNKIFDYFNANVKIIDQLIDLPGKNDSTYKIINKEIKRTCNIGTIILRKFYLYHQIKYYKEIEMIKKFVKENQRLFITSSDINLNEKIKLIMAVYCPRLLKKIDKIKFK